MDLDSRKRLGVTDSRRRRAVRRRRGAKQLPSVNYSVRSCAASANGEEKERDDVIAITNGSSSEKGGATTAANWRYPPHTNG
jgi:hypothetical protein